MAQTAITYPDTSLAYMTSADIRKTLEQLSDSCSVMIPTSTRAATCYGPVN